MKADRTCVICHKKFVSEDIDYVVLEKLKSISSFEIVTMFSHWIRSISKDNKNKSVCFTCYCKERENPKSNYIKPGSSYFYPDGWTREYKCKEIL